VNGQCAESTQKARSVMTITEKISFARAPGGRLALVVIGEKDALRLRCALGE